MKQPIEPPKWWLYIAKNLLIVTIVAVIYGFFCLWSMKYSGQGAIVGAMYFALLLILSPWITLLATIGIVTGFFLKYPLKQYLIIFIFSLLPPIFFVAFRGH